MKSINYFKAEVSTERQNGKYLRLGQTGNTNKSPLHFLCRTQCGSMGPCCTKGTKRSHAHGTKHLAEGQTMLCDLEKKGYYFWKK